MLGIWVFLRTSFQGMFIPSYSIATSSPSRPYIILLDSLNQRLKEVRVEIAKWLTEEAEKRNIKVLQMPLSLRIQVGTIRDYLGFILR